MSDKTLPLGEHLAMRQREAYERNVRPEIRALIDRGNVTLAEHNELRCNSWEWEALVPVLSIEALIAATEHAIKNCACARSPAITYDEAVHSVYAPELIERLRLLHAAYNLKQEIVDREAKERLQAVPTNEDFVREAMSEHCPPEAMDQRYITEWSRRFAPVLDKIRARINK